MRLQELLSATLTSQSTEVISGNPDTTITSLAYDSRTVRKGGLFFAISGHQTDGNLYVDQAIKNGACAIASEVSPKTNTPVTWIKVSRIRRFMAECANRFFGYPSQQLYMIGITGTNGKTTTAYLSHTILQGHSKALMMGSIKTKLGDEEIDSILTTPEAIDIQKMLKRGIREGCNYGVMEVSSHALSLDRVAGSHFPVAVFTNLSQDHLDFHNSFEAYFEAKQTLFQPDQNRGLKWKIVNGDDPFGRRLASEQSIPTAIYGFSSEADIHPIEHSGSVAGLHLQLQLFDRKLSLESTLIGRHNIYNIMAAVAACSLAGVPDSTIIERVRAASSIPGRFEKVDVAVPFAVVVDFAHTPDALSNVLDLAAELTSGEVICVFGCGGDRDHGKRPEMGNIAAQKSGYVIVTSDNPRTEVPEEIIKQIVVGIPDDFDRYETITSRRQAIERALSLAKPGDLVLLAGKGHETYQEIHGKKYDFDDRQVVEEALCSI